VETMPQITIDRAAYDIQKLINQSYPPFTYRNPVFYIPALTTKARKWFTPPDRGPHGLRAVTAGGSVIRAQTGMTQVTRQFTIDSVTEFVAIIPPAGRGKITIVAGFTGNVAATAS
jgi:hypothetical protein